MAANLHKGGDVAKVALMTVMLLATAAQAAAPLQFWNTSSEEFTGVYLSAPGTGQWGPNETANDPDGSVSPDERLKLPDVTPGQYDVRLVNKAGRSCVVKNVTVRAAGRYAFSIGDAELKGCRD
jgi:hypothetical protein